MFSPHLAWRNEPLRAALADRIELPVIVENDANAAAWAEYRFGVGQGERVIVCVTLAPASAAAWSSTGRCIAVVTGWRASTGT